MTNATTTTTIPVRTPVYFFSHGGPTFMYADQPGAERGDPGAFKMLRTIGAEIVNTIKPRAVVVISAHWQASSGSALSPAVEVNTAEMTDLIYDFYGFPQHMYEEKYPNIGSKTVAQRVMSLLEQGGISAKAVTRGLDHGVWVPFKVAFPEFQALKVPIVQVSLLRSEDASGHIALGKALAPLRDENILIIGSGMTVHNLREMRLYWNGVAPYSKAFDDMLAHAVCEYTGADREKALAGLIRTAEAQKAHPTKEHLLPIYVAAGAAYEDDASRVYTALQRSLAWGEYRFGPQPKA
ncbi:Extradiol ring-cleavage dioxygenase, class III enzyme, subunit B [Limtongia smithiae]|uniref:Extradiol ring-cleavage dioxygenase, class III enzyme, subunit B n=1 Tax=Limtongia smithiae TaxID=1125753 RepID=UPI0034CDC15B